MTEQANFKTSRIEFLTIFLSLSSAAIVVLALLGYGVATSAEARFGVPHALIFNSTSDLLTLGGWAVMGLLTYLDKLKQWGFYLEFWAKFWPMGTVLFLVAVGGALLAVLLAWLQRQTNQRVRVKAGKAALHAWLAENRRLVAVLAFPVVAAGGIFVAWPLATIAIVIFVACLGLALSVVPVLGHFAGLGHIDDWVVGPDICVPVKSREVRIGQPMIPTKKDESGQKPRAANCVAVQKDGQDHRGRVVFSTFNTIVLFDPKTGAVQRVPIDGARVQVIGDLPNAAERDVPSSSSIGH